MIFVTHSYLLATHSTLQARPVLVLALALAVVCTKPGGVANGDIRRQGTLQIIYPAPGSWLPISNGARGGGGGSSTGHQEDSGEEGGQRTNVLLEFSVADFELLAWLPPVGTHTAPSCAFS